MLVASQKTDMDLHTQDRSSNCEDPDGRFQNENLDVDCIK
ncbi:hypothetical protein ZOSMA_52G00260 [Zostera marina]|uniref:Uncharacterized protein n=1 Tax=Zostera marina TaxID=29655 RepID=A0A0K9NZH8_ZOSMR|nr:hypothetical protein ZOSMA_52G00260 [Zostera marina]